MYANGFLAEKRRSPVSLGAVIGLHAAALGAVIMFGTTTFVLQKEGRTTMINIPIDPPPPPVNPPPPDSRQPLPQQHQSRIDTPETPLVPSGPVVSGTPTPPQPPTGTISQEPVRFAEARVVVPDPVRIAAQVDPNYRAALQPPYPRVDEVAQREGQVRVRITIGTDGRVTSIEQISATSDSFWRATERQARSRWRFRPATVDGRAIVSTMVFTVTFRLPEA